MAWLYDHLRERLPGTEIFKDVNSIDPGDDFVTAITSALDSCDVLLAVIDPAWLMLTDAEGNRRLDDPEDFVRIEIETALHRGIRVIPILIDGAQMPTAKQLPPSLVGLARRHALELPALGPDPDIGLLIKVIEKTIMGPPPSRIHYTLYEQAISIKNPGCIVFLLDRSDSMGQLWNGKETMAEVAARYINDMLSELCWRARAPGGLTRHYFDIGIFGYGERPIAGGEGVEPAFGGALAGRALASLPDVKNNPIGIRKIASPGHGPSTISVPIWVEPAHGHRRPFCQAIATAGQHVFEWAQAHPASFPPIIINITNGMVTDSPYDGASLVEWAERLFSIGTRDGTALFFNIFLASESDSVMFPAAAVGMPAPGPDLFRVSSVLPPPMVAHAKAAGYMLLPGARGFVFNTDCAILAKFLGIKMEMFE